MLKRDIIIEYLNTEMIATKDYRKFMLGSGLLVLWGIVPGILLRSYWIYIGIAMLLIFVICTCITFSLMSKELTLKTKIVIQSLIFVCWYFQIGLISAIIFIHEYGINYKLIFLYLPSLLVCAFLFILTSIMLQNGRFTPKINRSIQGFATGFTVAAMGWRLGSILYNTSSQAATVQIILICFTIVNTILSVGFLNFQKMYYMHKIDAIDNGDTRNSPHVA